METKDLIINLSQYGKKAKSIELLQLLNSSSSYGKETLTHLCVEKMAELSKRHKSKTKQDSLVRSPFEGKVQKMTDVEAHSIISREVEPIVARKEPLSRLLDPFVQAELIKNHPAIGIFLPQDERTIFQRYVTGLDTRTTTELVSIFRTLPGNLNVAFDSDTFLGKSKVCLFFTMINQSLKRS